MGGAAGRSRVTAVDAVLAVLAAAAILALTLAGAQRSHLLTSERRAAADQAVVGAVAADVAVDLQRALSAVAEVARNATAPPSSASSPTVPGATQVGFDLPEPDASDRRAILTPAQRTDPDMAALLARARDSGVVVLGAPVDLGSGSRVLIVAASYTRDPSSGRPQRTVTRRQRLAGWAIAPVDLGELLRAHLRRGFTGSIRDGDTVVATVGDPSTDGLAQQTIVIDDRQLLISAGDPTPVGWLPPTVGILAGGAALAALAAAAVLGALRRLRERAADAAQRADQVQLIGEVAPLVQQSLELADVLPAVAVQLSDSFGLAGVAMSAGTSTAGQVELFSIGAAPAPEAKVVLRPPERLAAGETLALALQRGGRSVAVLQLVAGRDLGEADLQSLRALTELVTAAVVNASLYGSQQDALRQLRELDALKTVFLGTASHELRTPATAISGFASLLTTSWDRFDDEQRRDFVGRIGANARSLSAVVQDLLDFSLLDKGKVPVTLEPVDLCVVVEAVVRRLEGMFTNHDIAFAARPTPLVAADVNGLERIVTNLLTNAVKFSPEGTTVAVSVEPAHDGFGGQIVVSDEGPGIPVEERSQVFTRFYRGTGEAVVQTRGVGIGLSVVAELVARLHGDVLVDEAPGGGARFTVRLPNNSSPSSEAKEAERAPTT